MENQELIDQLKKLDSIKPSEEYAHISRSLILNQSLESEKNIITELENLRSISPNPEFIELTRSRIASLNRARLPVLDGAWNLGGFGIPRILSQALNFSFAVVLSIVSVAIITGSSQIKTAFMPELSSITGENITDEANLVARDIDIRLWEAEYFTTSANKTNVALNEALNRFETLKNN